jgi:hypothetical protein
MHIRLTTRLVCAAALAATPLFSHALNGITDTPGDFLSTFAGSSSSTDLDVIAATVLYDANSDLFQLSATMSGAVGTTATGVYVWGVNRGAGTVNAGFAANGIDGVRFDRVILLNANGTGSIGGGPALPAGSITISGNTITAIVDAALLPSTGFTSINYTWNLWPRDLAFASSGFGAISDFAPDNANFTTTAGVVPEPATVALMLAGLSAVGFAARRRRNAAEA